MANLLTQIFPANVMSKWEKLYHLLGRSYIYITHHPSVEACQSTQETVTLARVVKARYQDRSECLEFAERSIARYKEAVKSANERVSLLVHEREKLVEHLALNQTYFVTRGTL